MSRYNESLKKCFKIDQWGLSSSPLPSRLPTPMLCPSIFGANKRALKSTAEVSGARNSPSSKGFNKWIIRRKNRCILLLTTLVEVKRWWKIPLNAMVKMKEAWRHNLWGILLCQKGKGMPDGNAGARLPGLAPKLTGYSETKKKNVLGITIR